MVQSSFYLAAFAAYEQVYAVVLRLQNLEEGISEGSLGALALSWYRNGFVCAGRGLMFDQVFEVVIVDVVCVTAELAVVARDTMTRSVPTMSPFRY